MDDKAIMTTGLTIVKNIGDILFHGSIESSTPKIKTLFMGALDEYLNIQGDIFKAMESAGLYNMENVNESKITKVASKYNSTI